MVLKEVATTVRHRSIVGASMAPRIKNLVIFGCITLAIIDWLGYVGGSPNMLGTIVLSAVMFAIYFVPYIVAACRDHRQTMAICVLNLLLGWTLVAWVGALVWACTSDTEGATAT